MIFFRKRGCDENNGTHEHIFFTLTYQQVHFMLRIIPEKIDTFHPRLRRVRGEIIKFLLREIVMKRPTFTRGFAKLFDKQIRIPDNLVPLLFTIYMSYKIYSFDIQT